MAMRLYNDLDSTSALLAQSLFIMNNTSNDSVCDICRQQNIHFVSLFELVLKKFSLKVK